MTLYVYRVQTVESMSKFITDRRYVYFDRTCARTNILMCVVPQAGLQIDVENLHSKLPSLTTTYHKISTLLDGLGESSNFFAL